MSTSDFMGADRPCIQCQHFGGWRTPQRSAVWCLDGKIVHARPEHGCAFWTQNERAEKSFVYPMTSQDNHGA